jgi:hypothetical protein
LHAEEVVALARARGISISLGYVYQVRGPTPPRLDRRHGPKGAPKREFVRALPREMHVRKIVALAKRHGLSITVGYVYEVRGPTPAHLDRRARHLRSSKAAPKKAFILSLPPDLPPKQIVARASKRGLSITLAYVYLVRAAKRTRARRQPH